MCLESPRIGRKGGKRKEGWWELAPSVWGIDAPGCVCSSELLFTADDMYKKMPKDGKIWLLL